MKIYRKNDGGPRGEVKSEHVQCMMGLEAVKVFEPSVFILNSGDTPMMDQNTSSYDDLLASSAWVRGGAWLGCPPASQVLPRRHPSFGADHLVSVITSVSFGLLC